MLLMCKTEKLIYFSYFFLVNLNYDYKHHWHARPPHMQKVDGGQTTLGKSEGNISSVEY